jgi:hypothetical protein
MATKKVNIDIIARDKSKRALNNVRGSLDKLKSSVFNVRNALAGLGAGLVIRNLVNTGKELESLQTRFKFLLKDANEGAKAFENMTKFASKVPFSLEEIQAGSGILATVTDNADDLQTMLEITGNVAATTGLDFRTASEQIQRSFSAGIGAADLFREKGVRNMLGFKAGATVSIEETVEAFERVFGKGGQFGQATDELANTFEGTLSMIGDKFFNFKRTILEAGFFPELKKQFGDLDKFLEENAKAIDEVAIKIGQGLAQAVKSTAEVVKFLADNFEILKGILFTIIALKVAAFFHTLTNAIILTNKALMTLNFNFGVLGRKTKILTTAIALFNMEFGLMAKLEKRKEVLKSTARASVMLGEKIANLTKFQKVNKDETDKNTKSQKEYKNALVDMFIEQGILEDRQFGMSERDKKIIKEKIALRKEEEEELEKLIKTLKKELKIEQEIKALQEFQAEFLKIKNMQSQTEDVQIGLDTDELRDIRNELEQNSGALNGFREGIKAFASEGKTAFQSFKDVGMESVRQLQSTLTDFVMTGKLNFQSLAKSITRLIVEALIGQAIQSAIAKSESLLLMSSIRKAMRSVFEGALKTFASIPFPFNIAATGLAIKFGMGLVNKLKAFEKGGVARANQPALVGEAGPEIIMPRKDMQVIPNKKIGNMGGPVNVNFTINAIDTRGFRSLLNNERGTIVNIINQAVTDKGRPVLV